MKNENTNPLSAIPFLIALSLALLAACTSDSGNSWNAEDVCPERLRGYFTDHRDGREYKYTTIGDQVWMAENLNYKVPKSFFYQYVIDEFIDTSFFERGYFTISSCSGLNEDNCTQRGRNYKLELELILDSNGILCGGYTLGEDNCKPRVISTRDLICPEGWIIPSMEDWKKLMNTLDGKTYYIKATSGWKPLNPGDDFNGSNECGFTAISYDGYTARWWTSTQSYQGSSQLYDMSFGFSGYRDDYEFSRHFGPLGQNVIRCIKE